MSVYFIESGDLVKIGFSDDVATRVKAVLSVLPAPGRFLGFLPGPRSLEAHFHKVFSETKSHGEWFHKSDALLELIATTAIAELPDQTAIAPDTRLFAQEERYADEAAIYIRTFMDGLKPSDEAFALISASTGISKSRLRTIYDGEAASVTAGEYVVLRMAASVQDEAFHGPEIDGLREQVRRSGGMADRR